MKKNISFTVGIFITIFISMFFLSCRKIEGKKLDGKWKIVSLTSLYKYKNQKHETTFDGAKKTETYTVTDSAFTIDSIANYVETKTYTGAIYMDYHKDGIYNYSETFKDDTTGITDTKEIEGNWYFTDANHDSGYALDEILAMQVTKLTLNSNSGTTIFTTIYQGENILDFYQISTLTKDKIVLKKDKAETINFVLYVTTTEFTLEPR
jgi:hypothetical protein